MRNISAPRLPSWLAPTHLEVTRGTSRSYRTWCGIVVRGRVKWCRQQDGHVTCLGCIDAFIVINGHDPRQLALSL